MASVFLPYSIGYVTENKTPGVRHVNCLPIEDMPAMDGEVMYNPTEQVLQGTDRDGNPYQVRTITDSSVVAEWLPSASNRVTPPDLQRGELVELLRLGDSDQLYWRCLGLRDNLRRLETVIYAFNASPDGNPQTGVNFATCYFVEISTHKGAITVGTCKANGEPFAYTLQINALEGAINFIDDIGNQFEMDSTDRRLQLKNADNSYMRVERKTIDLKADEQIRFTCGGNILELKPEITSWTSKLVKVVTDFFDIV